MTRPPLATLAVLLVLAAGASVGARSLPRAPVAQTAEVVGASAVCPDLRQAVGRLTTRVSVGSAPLPAGRTATGGILESQQVTGTAAPVRLPVDAPGQVAAGLGARVAADGLVVTASGSLAAGLEVEQITRGETGLDRGLAGLRCSPPQTDAWFVGGGTRVGQRTVLLLANVDDTPALVDVAELSSTGQPDPRPGTGLAVAPHTRVLVSLDTLAPDRAQLAVHVTTRRGRVAAAVRTELGTGAAPAGVEWVPQSAAPAPVVVVPGLPRGPGTRTLLVANPGQDATAVQVQVTRADGQFVPQGLDAVDVPPLSTVVVPLTSQAATSALAVRVTTEGAPVLAAAVVQDTQPGTPVQELSFAGSTAPLSGPALLTDVVLDRPTESTLLLSALDAGATVLVSPIPVVGVTQPLPAPKQVQVAAGTTVSFRISTFLPVGSTRQLALEVRPLDGSGPVWAARYLRAYGARGPLTTLLGLQGPALRVPRPLVVRDAQAGPG